MQHTLRLEIFTQILTGNLNERDYLEDVVAIGMILLKLILRKYGGIMWTGFVWLRTVTNG